ncbi:S-adenosyl methyltransferase [Thermomonospora echinospora]|uniref:S-adenosyl methyltransferase n=1 Tax=Thermomonospora echinospora TaxID=1992 RepID=A0A1H6CAY3_9ACTN|nr:SAM-dependent methyltransferase [Thermomonospora echinospora]SEG70013.1 S-adenosyl methyltransferase [Thermomonospora echinospora]
MEGIGEPSAGAGRVPVGIDPTVPSIARVYDYMIGGKDNFASDRAVGDMIKEQLPGAVTIAVENRRVLGRAVRYLVRQAGIRQFIDIGSGLPTAENVHQVAQRHAPESRVVYVDSDPIVLAHGRALLDENDRTAVIQADARDPRGILDDSATRKLIDFDRPVGVILCAVLHHLEDEEDPAGIVATLREAVPSGSHLFITHFRTEHNEESQQIEQMLQASFGRGRWREQHEIESFFTGLEMVDPGIVPLVEWHPDTPPDREPTAWDRLIVGGIGRKP